MWKKIVSVATIFLFIFISSVFSSCERRKSGYGSISFDTSSFYNRFYDYYEKKLVSLTDKISVQIRIKGDYSYDNIFEGSINEFRQRIISIDKIPVGSKISFFISIARNGVEYYQGYSENAVIEEGTNYLDIVMTKVFSGRSVSNPDSFFPSPVISVTSERSGGVVSDLNKFTENGEYIVNPNNPIRFSVLNVSSMPKEAKYAWYINGELIENIPDTSYSIEVDYSKSKFFELSNKLEVFVEYEGIVMSNNFSFFISLESE